MPCSCADQSIAEKKWGPCANSTRVAREVLRCSSHPQPCLKVYQAQGEQVPGQCQLRSQSTAAEQQISHEKCPENILGLFLFCISLSSLAILLSAQPKVGQIETFEYKQPLEQLPILDVLAGEVASRVRHAPCPKLAHFSSWTQNAHLL